MATLRFPNHEVYKDMAYKIWQTRCTCNRTLIQYIKWFYWLSKIIRVSFGFPLLHLLQLHFSSWFKKTNLRHADSVYHN